jgi:hypothetical protein
MCGPIARGFHKRPDSIRSLMISGQSGRKTHNGLEAGKDPDIPSPPYFTIKIDGSDVPYPHPPSHPTTLMLTFKIDGRNGLFHSSGHTTPSSQHRPQRLKEPNINARAQSPTLPALRSGE